MLNKIIRQIIKDKKIIAMAVASGLVFTFCFALVTYAYSEKIQGGIADSVLRLHVRANSNSDYDQLLKEEVKNMVLDSLFDELPNKATKEESISYILENIEKITEVAEQTMRLNGYDYSVRAHITKSFFPTVAYGDVLFPAGNYDALRIDIGESVGENWWCVMFPPLCYVDLSVAELAPEDKVALKYALTSDEYEIVTSRSNDVAVKFKIVEWWQNRKADKSNESVVIVKE
jgi:stage II sporulation protein R